MSLIIGLSGLAGAGKDTFYSIFKSLLKGKQVMRYALADELKLEVREFMIKQYGIDILSCSREEKELVRPFLVFHGNFRRAQSKGQHWTSIVKKKIETEAPEIAVVTDVRYDVYENDEVAWLQNSLKGVLVHISQFTAEPTAHNLFTHKKVYLSPPNEHESKFDPIIKGKANYLVDWEKLPNETPEQMTERLTPHVQKFIDFLGI